MSQDNTGKWLEKSQPPGRQYRPRRGQHRTGEPKIPNKAAVGSNTGSTNVSSVSTSASANACSSSSSKPVNSKAETRTLPQVQDTVQSKSDRSNGPLNDYNSKQTDLSKDHVQQHPLKQIDSSVNTTVSSDATRSDSRKSSNTRHLQNTQNISKNRENIPKDNLKSNNNRHQSVSNQRSSSSPPKGSSSLSESSRHVRQPDNTSNRSRSTSVNKRVKSKDSFPRDNLRRQSGIEFLPTSYHGPIQPMYPETRHRGQPRSMQIGRNMQQGIWSHNGLHPNMFPPFQSLNQGLPMHSFQPMHPHNVFHTRQNINNYNPVGRPYIVNQTQGPIQNRAPFQPHVHQPTSKSFQTSQNQNVKTNSEMAKTTSRGDTESRLRSSALVTPESTPVEPPRPPVSSMTRPVGDNRHMESNVEGCAINNGGDGWQGNRQIVFSPHYPPPPVSNVLIKDDSKNKECVRRETVSNQMIQPDERLQYRGSNSSTEPRSHKSAPTVPQNHTSSNPRNATHTDNFEPPIQYRESRQVRNDLRGDNNDLLNTARTCPQTRGQENKIRDIWSRDDGLSSHVGNTMAAQSTYPSRYRFNFEDNLAAEMQREMEEMQRQVKTFSNTPTRSTPTRSTPTNKIGDAARYENKTPPQERSDARKCLNLSQEFSQLDIDTDQSSTTHNHSEFQSEIQAEMARAHTMSLPMNTGMTFRKDDQGNDYLNPNAEEYSPPLTLADGQGNTYTMTNDKGVCFFRPKADTGRVSSNPRYVIEGGISTVENSDFSAPGSVLQAEIADHVGQMSLPEIQILPPPNQLTPNQLIQSVGSGFDLTPPMSAHLCQLDPHHGTHPMGASIQPIPVPIMPMTDVQTQPHQPGYRLLVAPPLTPGMDASPTLYPGHYDHRNSMMTLIPTSIQASNTQLLNPVLSQPHHSPAFVTQTIPTAFPFPPASEGIHQVQHGLQTAPSHLHPVPLSQGHLSPIPYRYITNPVISSVPESMQPIMFPTPPTQSHTVYSVQANMIHPAGLPFVSGSLDSLYMPPQILNSQHSDVTKETEIKHVDEKEKFNGSTLQDRIKNAIHEVQDSLRPKSDKDKSLNMLNGVEYERELYEQVYAVLNKLSQLRQSGNVDKLNCALKALPTAFRPYMEFMDRLNGLASNKSDHQENGGAWLKDILRPLKFHDESSQKTSNMLKSLVNSLPQAQNQNRYPMETNLPDIISQAVQRVRNQTPNTNATENTKVIQNNRTERINDAPSANAHQTYECIPTGENSYEMVHRVHESMTTNCERNRNDYTDEDVDQTPPASNALPTTANVSSIINTRPSMSMNGLPLCEVSGTGSQPEVIETSRNELDSSDTATDASAQDVSQTTPPQHPRRHALNRQDDVHHVSRSPSFENVDIAGRIGMFEKFRKRK